jgi:hypothetical protein
MKAAIATIRNGSAESIPKAATSSLKMKIGPNVRCSLYGSSREPAVQGSRLMRIPQSS